MKDGKASDRDSRSIRPDRVVSGCGRVGGVLAEHRGGLGRRRDRGELGGLVVPVGRVRLIDPFSRRSRVGGPLRWPGPRRCVPRQVGGVGVRRVGPTARRAVAEAKAAFRAGRRRVYRPWIVEPGMWAQWDWGQGPSIAGRVVNLFCVVGVVPPPGGDPDVGPDVADGDRVCGLVDAPLGWGADVLVDRQRADGHLRPCGGDSGASPDGRRGRFALRGDGATCVPADPESKGGSEATVRCEGRSGPDRGQLVGRVWVLG